MTQHLRAAAKGEHWEVVGGGTKGGLLVREGAEMTSMQLPDRLSTGSVIEELEVIGDRLWYMLVSGSGPESGWVSVALKGRALLEKLGERKMQCNKLVPSADKDLPNVPIRWRTAADKGLRELVRELDLTLAEVLVEEDSFKKSSSRMPKLIQEMFAFLNELLKDKKPNVQAGGALVNCLFNLAASLSLHQVLAKRAPVPTAPCVLILGFGGSAIADLQPQAQFYQDRGFSTIACTPVSRPVALSFKQNQEIASQLSSALASGGRLLVHMCSNNGVLNGMCILGNWIAKKAPFDRLPPLPDILSALVFDCSPSFPTDPQSGEIVAPVAPETESKVESSKGETGSKAESDDVDPVLRSEIDFYVKVIMGTIGGLTAHWSTQFDKGVNPSLMKMVRQTPIVNECVRNAAAASVLQLEEYFDSAFDYQPLPFSMWDFESWELTLAKPLPRLFLYGEADFLVSQEKVEAYARHVGRYNPKAKVVMGKIPKAAHCMCFVQDKAKSTALMKELLSFADLSAAPMASSDMGA